MKTLNTALIGLILLLCAPVEARDPFRHSQSYRPDHGWEAPITSQVFDYAAGGRYYEDYPRYYDHERVRGGASITTRVFDYAGGRDYYDYPRYYDHSNVYYDSPITTRVFDYAAGGRYYEDYPRYYQHEVEAPITTAVFDYAAGRRRCRPRTAVIEERRQTTPVERDRYPQQRSKLVELLDKLKNPNKNECEEAVRELGDHKWCESQRRQARKGLEKVLLSDPNLEIRREAARSLGRLKSKDSLPALRRAGGEDPNEDVRGEIDTAIEAIEEVPATK